MIYTADMKANKSTITKLNSLLKAVKCLESKDDRFANIFLNIPARGNLNKYYEPEIYSVEVENIEEIDKFGILFYGEGKTSMSFIPWSAVTNITLH